MGGGGGGGSAVSGSVLSDTTGLMLRENVSASRQE